MNEDNVLFLCQELHMDSTGACHVNHARRGWIIKQLEDRLDEWKPSNLLYDKTVKMLIKVTLQEAFTALRR